MSRPNNLKPSKCKKFLEDNGWEFGNQEGSHSTYTKTINGNILFVQIVSHDGRNIYWQNAKVMIKRSGIPEKEWIRECT